MNQQQSPEKRMGYVEQKLDRILLYLLGDKDNKQQIGALAELAEIKEKLETLVDKATHSEIEQRVAKLERFKDRSIWIFVGFAFGAGIGIGKLFDILKL